MDRGLGPNWRRDGNDALYAKLDASHVILEDGSPIAAKVEAGDTITVTSQSGKTTELTVLGFYRDQMAYAGMMVSLDTLKKLDVPTAAGMMLVRTDGSAGVQQAVQEALAEFPTQKVQTKPSISTPQQADRPDPHHVLRAARDERDHLDLRHRQHPVLSVHERTREIGMLRVIGATRRQVRQMVRYESVITAVIGGVLGTAVGIAFAYVVVTQLGGDGLQFLVPWLQLGVLLGVGRGRRRRGRGAAGTSRRQHTDPGGHPVGVGGPIARSPGRSNGRGPGRRTRPGPFGVSGIGCATSRALAGPPRPPFCHSAPIDFRERRPVVAWL